MFTLLIVIMIILSVLLILVVLVQPGKGEMLAGMGEVGGAFTSMFGSRKASDLLTKLTIGFAAGILLLSLVTNMFFVGGEQTLPKPVTEGVQMPSTAVPQTVPLEPAQPPVTPPVEE